MIESYLNYIQESNYSKEIYKVSARIPIELHFSPMMIEKWSKWKPVTLELSHERFEQYKNYFKDINKYLVALNKATRMKVNDIIKKVTIFVMADKRKHSYAGTGKNITSSNKSHTYIALGIESKPHALVYFCHELGHSFITVDKNWNKKQLELSHMMIEYFTDWTIWNKFNIEKNVFVTRGHKREEFNKLINKEYSKSNIEASRLTSNIVSRYKEYSDYIRVRNK